jgi:hypothetical protein
MKIELEKVIGAVIVVGGIVFGYGQLTTKVDNLQEYNDTEIRKLADDNMNDIIVLKTKMNLLVTPQMSIVSSNSIMNKLAVIESWIKHEEKKKEERRLEDLYDDRRDDEGDRD